MEPSEVGRYGTLRLMKRLEPDVAVASYPIDDEEMTFGCDPECSVRLYYPTVSPIHGKITFHDKKAFLIVLGTSGLAIDGCQVFPSGDPSAPTTIPIPNNSEILINHKRFRFLYPPKELRTFLHSHPVKSSVKSLAKPVTPGKRRAVRMSMIQSAEVFTPRPSRDPSENLRILQSPLKPRPSSPLKQMLHHQPEESDEWNEEIVLVQGDQPQVVEEEEDLVIVEDVEVDDKSPPPVVLPPTTPKSTSRTRVFSTPNPHHSPSSGFPRPLSIHQSPAAPPKTPRNRSNLHRALLIRSVQRAVLKAEMEKEQEQEESEVADAVVDQESTDDSDQEEKDELLRDHPDEDVVMDTNDSAQESEPKSTLSSWRSSLQAMTNFVRFRSSSPTKDDSASGSRNVEEASSAFAQEPMDKHLDDENNDLYGSSKENRPSPLPVGRSTASPTKFTDGPRRVPIEQSWKVKDLVLDPPDSSPKHTMLGTPRQKLSEAERRAISERRRSALVTPDAFFGGLAPGTRRSSVAPVSPALSLTKPIFHYAPDPPPSPSPQRVATSSYNVSASPGKPLAYTKEDDSDDEDTERMLARMRKTAEGMRRRSIGIRQNLGTGRASLSPQKAQPTGFSLLAPGAFDGEIFHHEDESKHLPASNKDPALDQIPERQSPSPVTQHTTKRPTTAEEMVTPKMNGVRDMFLRARELQTATPLYDGIGNMLAAPLDHDEVSQGSAIEPMVPSLETQAGPPPTDDAQRMKEEMLEDDPDTAEIATSKMVVLMDAAATSDDDDEISIQRGRTIRKSPRTRTSTKSVQRKETTATRITGIRQATSTVHGQSNALASTSKRSATGRVTPDVSERQTKQAPSVPNPSSVPDQDKVAPTNRTRKASETLAGPPKRLATASRVSRTAVAPLPVAADVSDKRKRSVRTKTAAVTEQTKAQSSRGPSRAEDPTHVAKKPRVAVKNEEEADTQIAPVAKAPSRTRKAVSQPAVPATRRRVAKAFAEDANERIPEDKENSGSPADDGERAAVMGLGDKPKTRARGMQNAPKVKNEEDGEGSALPGARTRTRARVGK